MKLLSSFFIALTVASVTAKALDVRTKSSQPASKVESPSIDSKTGLPRAQKTDYPTLDMTVGSTDGTDADAEKTKNLTPLGANGRTQVGPSRLDGLTSAYLQQGPKNKILQKRIRDFSAESAKTNVDVRGCKLLKTTNASCYGKGDNFNGKKMANGLIFETSLMTVAYPERAMMNAILVVYNPETEIGREVVVTDIGPSATTQKTKGRGIDLSAAAMDSLGGAKCPNVIKGLQVYNCPVWN